MADQLKLAVEGWLAEMPENEFRALYARVRPPTEPLPQLSKGATDGQD